MPRSSQPEPPVDPIIIAAAPELALLAVLDELVTMTLFALCAAHPGLADGDPDSREQEDPAQRSARLLVRRLYACRSATSHYRRSTLRDLHDPRDDADVPF